MTRQEIINRIVARKLQPAGQGKDGGNARIVVGCVPCFGGIAPAPAANRGAAQR